MQRPDVRETLNRHGLRADQTLENLGTIARFSATNPYELKLERVGKGEK
jgi:hypothetical protein